LFVFQNPDEEIRCIEQGAVYAGGLKVIKMVTLQEQRLWQLCTIWASCKKKQAFE